MANIIIETEYKKLDEVRQLLSQIAELEKKIASRDETAANKNWIGFDYSKNSWSAETEVLRNSVQLLNQNYTLTVLRWAKGLI